MLDFIADNYLWFIVLGAALLVIALILLFTRKKPIKEEVSTVQPDNKEEVVMVESTGNTEVLEIIDDVEEPIADASSDVQTVINNGETVEEFDPFVFESQMVEPIAKEENEALLENTIVEPINVESLTIPESNAEEIVFDEPISIDSNVVEPFVESVVSENVETMPISSTEEIVFDEPVLTENNTAETFAQPVVNSEITFNEPASDVNENSINVGNVVIPQEDVNKDSIPVNSELDEDIWKF